MKNNYEIRGDVTAIFLNSPRYGKMEALISTSKLDLVKTFPNKWRPVYEKKTNSFYVFGTLERDHRTFTSLHRWVLGMPKGGEVDHINHDTLDNTDDNLRLLTTAENQQNRNRLMPTNVSGVQNVHWHKPSRKWNVQIRLDGRTRSFGYYDDLEEARKVAIEVRSKLMPFWNKDSMSG